MPSVVAIIPSELLRVLFLLHCFFICYLYDSSEFYSGVNRSIAGYWGTSVTYKLAHRVGEDVYGHYQS